MKIFSGIRPSGEIHIGNYLGAIKQWLELQKKHECVFCVVDWHAITTPYDPKKLQKNIQELAIAYLAAGIDPAQHIFFVQSQVKEHAELAWLLGVNTPTGDLFRMTQYKEKSQAIESPSAGLLNYPILMAADILLYQTDLVPVGEDQKQHVEFAREIARRFNKKYGPIFKLPKSYLSKTGSRVMSLQNPAKKMSKNDPKGCLGLFDEPEEIRKKIMPAVTDSGKEVKYDLKKKPGVSNLLAIYAAFSNKEIKETEKDFAGKGYADFKKSLTELLINSLEPFRQAKKDFSKERIAEIMSAGAEKARTTSQETILKTRKAMGLM